MTGEVPLRRLFRVVNGGTPTSDPVNWDGEVPWATPVDLATCDGSVLSGSQRTLTVEGLRSGSTEVPAGSLLLSTRAPIGYVAQTACPAAFNQGCRGLVPRVDLETRYYRYVLTALKERLVAAGQGSTFVELSTEGLASTRVPLLPVAQQRAIADYLDIETARIDALIAKKRRLEGAIMQRLAAHVEQEIRGLAVEWGEAPLKFLAERVTVGIVVTPAAWYVHDDESGVIALRGTNVAPDRFRLDDVVRISQEGHALHAKSALRAGDVVVVRTGQAGAAAVVPPSLEGANCIDLILVRPGQLDADFLQFVLNSDWTQKHISEHSVGTIQSHFNVGAMKGLPVPRAPRAAQREVAARLKRYASRSDQLCTRLRRQIELLQEHRQALVTAAVTGELEIPGVA